MATLTIRNVEDEVVKRLKERAKLNERSMEAECLTSAPLGQIRILL
jgi:plasmid stability protein